MNKINSLNMKIEKISISGMSAESREQVYAVNSTGEFLEIDKNIFLNGSPPVCQGISLSRDLSNDDLLRIKMDIMPGLKVSWNYTDKGKNVKLEHKYFSKTESKIHFELVRLGILSNVNHNTFIFIYLDLLTW